MPNDLVEYQSLDDTVVVARPGVVDYKEFLQHVEAADLPGCEAAYDSLETLDLDADLSKENLRIAKGLVLKRAQAICPAGEWQDWCKKHVSGHGQRDIRRMIADVSVPDIASHMKAKQAQRAQLWKAYAARKKERLLQCPPEQMAIETKPGEPDGGAEPPPSIAEIIEEAKRTIEFLKTFSWRGIEVGGPFLETANEVTLAATEAWADAADRFPLAGYEQMKRLAARTFALYKKLDANGVRDFLSRLENDKPPTKPKGKKTKQAAEPELEDTVTSDGLVYSDDGKEAINPMGVHDFRDEGKTVAELAKMFHTTQKMINRCLAVDVTARRAKEDEERRIWDAYSEKFGSVPPLVDLNSRETTVSMRRSVDTGEDEFAEERRQWGKVIEEKRREHEAFLAKPITARTEKSITAKIKNVRLREGDCNRISWVQYFKFRDEHADEVEPLSELDLAYASQWTTCAVPQGNADELLAAADVANV